MKRASKQTSSSSTDSPVVVGRIGRPHGVRGRVTVVAAHPGRFQPGARFVTDEAEPRPLVVQTVGRHAKGALILGFEGITDRSAAEELRGANLTIPHSARRQLEEEEFWPEELEGLEVRSPEGARLGWVRGVVFGEAQDRLVLELVEGRNVEVPFVDELVREVRIEEGFLVIEPIEGLLA
jgi:16S rRNA processing protein RimM